ncbi:surf-like protein [Lobulomyces angularis]|nr:surf-like protein [Lobulomyces angularis]
MVKVKGEFQQGDTEFHLGPRNFPQPPTGSVFSNQIGFGYFLISPFTLVNGERILVNRGWIHNSHKNEVAKRSLKGIQSYKGLIKFSEKKNMFIPENEPSKNQWYSLDSEMISSLANTLPVVVEITSDEEIKSNPKNSILPIPKPPTIDLPNNHLSYAITWFGMCLFSSAMLFTRGGKRKFNKVY